MMVSGYTLLILGYNLHYATKWVWEGCFLCLEHAPLRRSKFVSSKWNNIFVFKAVT